MKEQEAKEIIKGFLDDCDNMKTMQIPSKLREALDVAYQVMCESEKEKVPKKFKLTEYALFRDSMKIGCLFNEKYENSELTDDWNASEECCEFVENIMDYAELCDKNIADVFESDAYRFILDINERRKKHSFPSHMWDEICKGFLAGQILGMPTELNLRKVEEAEKLWEDTDAYGYYQEVLNEVR